MSQSDSSLRGHTHPPFGWRKAAALGLVICSVVSVCLWTNRPFPARVYEKHRSLQGLSAAQRANVAQAFKAIDHHVVQPHRVFSMDQVLGPRRTGRGYQSAPAYYEQTVAQDSIGGGICVVSSMVYEAALAMDLPIVERKPHTRPVRSVPMGLDATLWEDQVDLKFKNPWNHPLQLRSQLTPEGVTLQIWSQPLPKPLANVFPLPLHRQVRHAPGLTEVVVYRGNLSGTGMTRISRDWYRH